MSTFQPHFNQHERLYSEALMKYWTNFAKTGNPKAPWRDNFLNMEPQDWRYYDVDWPEFNPINQSYLHLGITPIVSHRYRYKYMRFWNHELPIEYSKQLQLAPLPPQPKAGALPPPFIDFTTKYPPVLMRRTTSSGGIIEGHVNLYPMQHRPPKHDDPFKKLHRKLNPDAVPVMVNSPSGIDTVPPKEFQNKEEVETYDIFKSESTLTMLIGIVLLFLIFNIFVIIGFFVRRQITKRKLNRKYTQNMFDAMTDEKRSKYNETDDSYIMDIIRRNESNTYEAIKATRLSGGKGFILSRQLSSSTVDAHTKVTDWISQDMTTCSSIGSKNSGQTDVDQMNCLQKPEKVNVAVDATPAGRGGSVLRQEPIELMKARSIDYGFVKDVIICQDAEVDPILEAAPLRFENTQDLSANHQHSTSDSIEPMSLYGQQNETVTSFIDDINVTSRDEDTLPRKPLTPEESLLGIQRRNFPKVLPDYLPDDTDPYNPDKSYKRLSLPPQYFLMQSPVNKDFNKIPPAPPPRISSTLGRRPSNNNRTSTFMTSPIKFADEPPVFTEPPTQVNTISVGPLVPKHNNPEAIYLSMRRMNSIQENQNSRSNIDSTTMTDEYENKEVPDEAPKITSQINGNCLSRQNSSNSDSSTASSTGTIKKIK